ncbi:MAG: LCP family protein [Oscillospiraceae bacterium]|nr:LCP family protein [Oscillospiraceae bacterium]MDD6526324.1 LCP family protein [Oscillospiraceae bacterium]
MKFIRRHKILVTVLCIVIVLFAAIFATGFHYLNKISYDDGSLVTAPTDTNQEEESDLLNGGTLSDEEAAKLAEADSSIQNNASKIRYSDDVYNILLMGIDYGSKNYPYGRSDSMILVSINKNQKTIKLVSLSRAAYAAIRGYKNTRLSHAHGYGGAPLAIDTVERNYKIRIDRYVSVGFDSFKKIIDAFGGVSINLTSVEQNVLNGAFPGKFPSAGTYTLNGEQALVYARLRATDNDRTRTGRQRNVLMALSQKAKSMSVTDALGILNVVLPLVRTNFTRTELVKQAANALSYLKWDISQDILPVSGTGLVLRDQFEVILVDWEKEVSYTNDLLFKGVEIKYENK